MDISDTAKFVKDTDYFMMTYEQRALDMDRLDAPVGHVITGLKIRSLGGHLNLEIQVNFHLIAFPLFCVNFKVITYIAKYK